MQIRLRYRSVWVLLVLFFCVQCSDKATEDDLQLWKNTKKGRKKIAAEVVRNTQQDFAIRVRAIEVLVENGHTYDARDALKDAPGYLDMLNALVPVAKPGEKPSGLLRLLYDPRNTKQARGRQAATRDFLYMAIQLLGPKHPQMSTRIRTELIRWTFNGLDLDTPLNKANFDKIFAQGGLFLARVGYIENLRTVGALAADPLCKLVKQNVETHAIVKLLTGMKNPAVSRKLLVALDALAMNPAFKITEGFIEMVRSVNTDEASILLMKLGTDKNRVKSADLRDTAIENAKWLAKKLSSGAILPHFYAAMAKKGKSEERFYAALDVLEIGGVTELSKVVAAFKDDGLYGTSADAQKENINNFLYFSLQVVQYGGRAVPPLVQQLTSKNPIAKVLAILSLKLLGDKRAIPALQKVADDSTVFKQFHDSLTIGRLAQNAVSAIPIFAMLHEIAREKKLGRKQLHNLVLSVCQNLSDVGETLAKDMYKNVLDAIPELDAKLFKPKGKRCCKVCVMGQKPCGKGCVAADKACTEKVAPCVCIATGTMISDKAKLLKDFLATVPKDAPKETPKKKKKKKRKRGR